MNNRDARETQRRRLKAGRWEGKDATAEAVTLYDAVRSTGIKRVIIWEKGRYQDPVGGKRNGEIYYNVDLQYPCTATETWSFKVVCEAGGKWVNINVTESKGIVEASETKSERRENLIEVITNAVKSFVTVSHKPIPSAGTSVAEPTWVETRTEASDIPDQTTNAHSEATASAFSMGTTSGDGRPVKHDVFAASTALSICTIANQVKPIDKVQGGDAESSGSLSIRIKGKKAADSHFEPSCDTEDDEDWDDARRTHGK